jgi:outer membrane protein TolC
MRGVSLRAAYIAIIIFLAGQGSVFAETYSLDQCIETALQNNYGIVAARNNYDVARGQVYTAWGDFLPTISINANANRNWPAFFDVYLQKFRTDSYSGSLLFFQTYGGLGLSQYANLRRRYNERGSAFYNLSSAHSELVQQVKENYYDLLRTRMLVDVASDAVRRGEERLRVTQSRYDLGSASMSDVLKAKVQFGNDRLDLVTQTNSHKLAQANLAFTMGIDVNREIEVDENFPRREFDISFDQTLSEALSNNPDYRKAGFDLGVAKDLRLISYANLLPSLTLRLRHRTYVAEFGSLTDFKGRDASYEAYAGLDFNIFNGFNDYAQVRAARRNVDTNEQALRDTENRVALELKQAFLDIEQSEEAKRLADESVAAAQEDLNLVREKYNLGAATILEVLDAEVSLKEAQTSRVEAIFNYNLAISRLEKVLGR